MDIYDLAVGLAREKAKMSSLDPGWSRSVMVDLLGLSMIQAGHHGMHAIGLPPLV